MSASKNTPMMQQYLAIKEKYPDAILFYRMGDFYEMFLDDAVVAARVLEITLTSRNKNDTAPVPMCGVPYRAARAYIARLIENGYKVAICDQVEEAAQAKGLVRREVVQVITPGMIVDTDMLDAKDHNYLLALAKQRETMGLAYIDITTGLFRVVETGSAEKIVDEIQRIGPREVLLSDTLQSEPMFKRVVLDPEKWALNWLPATHFEVQRGRARLLDQFQTRSLEGFGCERMTAGLGAAGALLDYIQETQKQSITHLQRIVTYRLDEHLILDHMSRQNLELEKNLRTAARPGSLLAVIDRTVTAMGSRRLKQWLRYPLISPERIGRRLDAVEEAFAKGSVRRRIVEALGSVYDLERLHGKIAMGHSNARDLLSLGRSLAALPPIWEDLRTLGSDLYSGPPPLDALNDLAAWIERAIREDAPPGINEGGMIQRGYDAALDELIRISIDAKGYLAQLEGRERQSTGINTLKVRYNKVFGYYIEMSKAQAAQAPERYVRKQTLVNAERYITDELKQFENSVLGAEEKRCVLELELFNQLRERVKALGDTLQAVAHFLARLDCLLSLAEVADRNDYCRPTINRQGVIRIKEGRHPVVETMIHGERFVPNSIQLDNDTDQILIITGPNMAGKSTILRQVALLVIMAQMGGFVPAAEADISVTDRIFTRVGALDNLSAGQSTFMVEMEETANILHHATDRSLVIMDEIGRGTSTYDGLSIAWAVVEYLHDLKAKGTKTLFATHYHELTELARLKHRVKNYNIAVKEWNDQIIFLRKLVPGGTNRSYGIHVAQLAGIPGKVIQRARKVLARVEKHAPGGGDVAEAHESDAERSKPVQLDLFQSVEREIVDRLQTLDLNTMTPLEALTLLHHLKEKMMNRD
jgi:DNA mismatch repair protein MutS